MEKEISPSVEVSAAGAELGDRWDRYVEAHDAGSLCHLFAWRTIVEESYRLEATFLVAERGRGRIEGVLPLVKVPGLGGAPALVSMPFLDQGGILADSPPVAAALRQAALKLMADTRARSLDLRGGADVGPAAGDRFLARLPLPPTRDELWSKIGGKVRNLVRKAEREGVRCERTGCEGLIPFYDIFSRNMLDAGSPVHSLAFFRAILDHLSDRTALYLVRSSTGRNDRRRARDSISRPGGGSLGIIPAFSAVSLSQLLPVLDRAPGCARVGSPGLRLRALFHQLRDPPLQETVGDRAGASGLDAVGSKR